MNCKAFVAALAVLVGGSQAQNPQVTLSGLGTMEGYTGNAYVSDRLFYHFRGVPFAQPPVDDLRFKAPVPVEPWTGVMDAHSSFGHRCPQNGPVGRATGINSWQSVVEDMAFGKAEEDSREDCLFLQVYSPNLDPLANLPVLVFFHGGAFSTGSSRLYGGNKFMDHDIVLVVPHYRLGPLGFLSLQNDEIPGNAGMLDQVEALQWIQNHISQFGGDPNKVTVMGESSGAVGTSMLNLSPLATDLFHQYIVQSGAAIANWGIDPDPISSAIDLGRLAGCTDPEINALTQCLKTIEFSELNKAYMAFQVEEMKAGKGGFRASSPVIQQAGAKRFIERSPRELYETGNYNGKPALLGANKHEGTINYNFLYQFYLKPNGLTEDAEFLSGGFTKFLLEFLGAHDQGDTLAIGVESKYFGESNLGNLTLMNPGTIDVLSDMYIKGPIYSNVEFNTAKGADSYLYSFHYSGSRTLYSYVAPISPIPGGICHGNEMILQFTIPTFTTNDQDKVVSNQIISLWANFVKYGNPTPASNPVEGVPTWPAWTKEEGSYLIIDTESTVAQGYSKNDYFVCVNENFPNA